MCNQITLKASVGEVASHFKARRPKPTNASTGDMWKGGTGFIVRENAGERVMDAMTWGFPKGSVAKIVKLEHAWRRLDGRNDDGFQVAPFPG
jgi:putative SOS response-associated peptidase YedK